MANQKGNQKEEKSLKYLTFFIMGFRHAFVTSTLITFSYIFFSWINWTFSFQFFLFVSLPWSFSTPGRKVNNSNYVFLWTFDIFENTFEKINRFLNHINSIPNSLFDMNVFKSIFHYKKKTLILCFDYCIVFPI